MRDSVFFATFDPLFDAPEVCTLCATNPPTFHYEFCSENEEGERKETQGFCCERCSIKLLKSLEATESREWQEEEAALVADQLDIADFQKRRLATFGTNVRH